MKVSGYLIVERAPRSKTGARQGTDKMRLVKTKPRRSDLKASEIMVEIEVEIPDSAFQKPEFRASVAVDETQVELPEQAAVTVTQKPLRIKRSTP